MNAELLFQSFPSRHFQDQLPEDLPDAVGEQLLKLKERVERH